MRLIRSEGRAAEAPRATYRDQSRSPERRGKSQLRDALLQLQRGGWGWGEALLLRSQDRRYRLLHASQGFFEPPRQGGGAPVLQVEREEKAPMEVVPTEVGLRALGMTPRSPPTL